MFRKWIIHRAVMPEETRGTGGRRFHFARADDEDAPCETVTFDVVSPFLWSGYFALGRRGTLSDGIIRAFSALVRIDFCFTGRWRVDGTRREVGERIVTELEASLGDKLHRVLLPSRSCRLELDRGSVRYYTRRACEIDRESRGRERELLTSALAELAPALEGLGAGQGTGLGSIGSGAGVPKGFLFSILFLLLCHLLWSGPSIPEALFTRAALCVAAVASGFAIMAMVLLFTAPGLRASIISELWGLALLAGAGIALVGVGAL